MVLSLTLHGLAVLPLFLIAGTLGSTSQEPALIVEFSVAAPTVGPNAEPDGTTADLPSPPEPSLPTPVEMAAQPTEPQRPTEATPPPEAVAQIAIDLPPPEEAPPLELIAETAVELPPPEAPPPVKVTELKPVEPPKPKPAAPKPAAPRPAAKPAAAQAVVTPDTGNAAVTQQATAAPAETAVFVGRARYRTTPKPPVYPSSARELGQQGEVVIRVRLDLDGSAAEIKLWRSSGFEALDRSALAAVRGWSFHPETRGGHPVPAWVEFPVRFNLH